MGIFLISYIWFVCNERQALSGNPQEVEAEG